MPVPTGPIAFEQQLVDSQAKWTGGQFSVLRVCVGIVLCAHFACGLWIDWAALESNPSARAPLAELLGTQFPGLYRWGAAQGIAIVGLLSGCLLSVLFAAGLWLRALALPLGYLLLSQAQADAGPSGTALACLLAIIFVFALQPAAPYGSWPARGRVDPGGTWRAWEPSSTALWAVLIGVYGSQAWLHFQDPNWRAGRGLLLALESDRAPLEAFNSLLLRTPDVLWQASAWVIIGLEAGLLPLALIRRLHWIPWIGLALTQVFLLIASGRGDPALALLLLHLCTFDPSWLAPKTLAPHALVFYDGDCGLCHRFVRMILAEDSGAPPIRLAPLQSPAFTERTSEAEREALPDSIVLYRGPGQLAVRTRAVLPILAALGGIWRAAGLLLNLLPGPLADFGYDCIAKVRKRIFKNPKSACPMLPPHLAGRFEFDLNEPEATSARS